MSKYKLIAFDMDGTLLNSEKKISAKTLEAINEAIKQGKEVVLSTGRGLPELSEYTSQIPGLRYMVCVSGAMVYDIKTKKVIYSNAIPPCTINKILEVSKDEDVFIQILTTESIVEGKKIPKMADYHMEVYKSMFEQVTTKVESIYDYYENTQMPVEKINIYHTCSQARNRTKEKLKVLELELADAEYTSVECSAKYTTKGTGLMELCKHLDINIKDTIAVGDADNDADVLKIAGLSIAMGNAKESIKEMADYIVADCDSNGCAEAIYKYLL